MYRFFNSRFGNPILKSLGKYIYVNNLNKKKTRNKYPFHISITIDTESGYIKKNDQRVWQKSNPKEYIGYYKGIENWRNLLNKYDINATFFLSTNCFSAEKKILEKIKTQLKLLIKEGHEIGLHIHPDSDLALQKITKQKYKYTSAKYYSKKELNTIISVSKKLIKNHLGIVPKSIRWGNWALNTNSVDILEKNKFILDSSATPGIKGHKNKPNEYNWSISKSPHPWYLSKKNYQKIKKPFSNVLEIPISTFKFFGKTLRADPANLELLKSSFDYYSKNVDRSTKPYCFVIISHSNESTHKNGTTTKVISTMDEFIKHVIRNKNTKFVTLIDHHKQYLNRGKNFI